MSEITSREAWESFVGSVECGNKEDAISDAKLYAAACVAEAQADTLGLLEGLARRYGYASVAKKSGRVLAVTDAREWGGDFDYRPQAGEYVTRTEAARLLGEEKGE